MQTCCELACKNCHEIITSSLILLRDISSSVYSPETVGKWLSYGGNVYPTYSRDLERCHLLYIRELQRQASGKRQQPRSALSRFTLRLHYTISNKPEYCILRSHVFRSSGFSRARAQWNVRIRCIFCQKICTGISVAESGAP